MTKMLRLAIALGLVCVTLGQLPDLLVVPTEKNVLSPPYFNIASGKKIEATATCGDEQDELFCKLTGGTNFEFSNSVHQGQVCDICDSTIPEKAHPVKNAIDGTEKWWQSPPLSRGSEYNKVNLTIHLGQVFHVAYVLIKFANSPRAGTWVLEKSSDHGKSFQPWQYFANTDSDCYNLFGMDSLEEITRDDSVICTSDYSSVVPLENGEVIVSMIKARPGANNFSYATVLQEWSKATDVRLRFLRTKTLLGHLMAVSEQDPTVTRRYYYSIKDISIGGRCVCNGHADTCSPDPSDQYKLKCECRHNTCGDSCERCCEGFVQKAWRAAVPESTNQCEACNCHGHTTECEYDEDVARRRLSLDLAGNYEGGGVCLNCQHHTAGINCEQCASGYWRPSNVDPRDPNGCRPCDCDSTYTVGSCEPNTGRCYCKVQYAGDRCDSCAPGYYDFPECRACDCYYNGTLNDVCLPVGDACPCKYNFAGKYCDECAAGFYNFPQCDVCECTGEGVASDVCDPYTGACPCADGFAGPSCTECASGYFNYPLCQRCPCSDVGTIGNVCDPVTGQCFCGDKYSGQSCDDCRSGYFGFPVCQECQCTAPGSLDNTCDSRSGRCHCKRNYQGESCEECAPEFYGYPNCVSCDCNVRGSQRTTCDQTNGQCLCLPNIGGRSCDHCTPDYFNFPRCEECSCDARGIESVVQGVCLAFTTGQCECKPNVIGRNCDMCKPLHYDLDQGCVSCNCFIQGTLDGVGDCDSDDGQCFCKPYTCTQRCSQCVDGFYSLEELNYLGCTSCECDIGGAMTVACDKNTGQCQCRSGVAGRRCNRAADGYFYPTLYQYQYELEYGKTPENNAVRYGFDGTQFPDFSMSGYAKFSVVQSTIVMHAPVNSHNLYRAVMRYVNPTANIIPGTIFFVSSLDGAGDSSGSSNCVDCPGQSQKVTFEVSNDPRMVTVPTPFVLNRGTWTIVIEAQPGLLIDYLVLLPSEYYEPGILQLSTTVPCVPSLHSSDTECVMFTHPSLGGFTMLDATQHPGSLRLDTPSTAHPEMLLLDGTSGVAEQQTYTVDIDLPAAGKYVLVLEYANTDNKFQRSLVTVTDGAANQYSDVKFNIYACAYSFLCRQVALGVLDDVKVFDLSLPTMRVTMTTEPGSSIYIKSLTAIPYSDWTMELVEPKPLCITTQGPEFDQCVTSAYPIPHGSSKFNIPATPSDGDEEPAPPKLPETLNDESVQLIYLDGANSTGGGSTTLQIPMNLSPGRYVFLVHFYNPDHTSFAPRVVIDGGVASTGSANISYCPHADGCRAVVTKDDGSILVDITVPTSTFTITVPNGKAFWVQYVLAVPEADYNPSLLDLSPSDKSTDFIRKCSTDGQQSFYGTLTNPSEFCQESIFSLTVNHNAGALPCNCSGAGTVGGGEATCEEYGGQCPCRPNVIGRQCERCRTGFFGYPDCQPCDCVGAMCDTVDGNCICPINTVAPACNQCKPLTHSFDPIQGCLECDCNPEGVENVTDRGCSVTDGQCNCKDTVTGQRCDRCKPGYFGFPNCQKCQCDVRGRVSDGCNQVTGQCLCKPNVDGLQCDRCKDGSFNLNGTNPNGCTECFCFGVSSSCTPTQYPATEIYDMTNWRMLYLVEPMPSIETSLDGQTVRVDVNENGGPQDPYSAKIYWAAPKTYLAEKVGSYGGDLRYTASYSFGGRGDADFGSSSSPGLPAPLLAPVPDVILKGNNMVIGWVNEAGVENVNLKLSEHNFKHEQSNIEVTRAELMMVLSDLQALHIRAAPDIGVSSVSLRDVVLTTTDYSLPLGSGPTIPSVEECSCPEGYHGHSCEFCDAGYYRDERGPYLGYCKQCDCYGHCITCDKVGPIKSSDCLHNTGGKNCDVCVDGYIGNATSGEVDACQPCPCPFPMEDGNFADTCEELDGELVCHCQVGYTGARCELCANGYFGNPAVYGGSCQPCNCHGNLDPNLIMETCDPLTGECTDCMFNTGGKYCERCADGYFGDAIIARNCSECSCDSCGTDICDHVMGHCSCMPHVIGNLCDACEPGFFNFQSCSGCQNCACAEGALGSVCDVNSGQCECAPNIVGVRCDTCAPGFYEYSAMGCKPCNCRNNGPCNPVNGQCECPPGITGVQCDQCELARHILPPGARECERCGTCTDDLLDEIEPMTDEVRTAFLQLANISVGVHAYRRLQDVQNMIQTVINNTMIEEGFMTGTKTDVGNLLGGGLADLGEMVSGSGADIDGSGMFSGPAGPRGLTQPPSFSDIFLVISHGEAAVSEMCNHTEILLGIVTETENVTMNGLANAMALENVSGAFMADANDLKNRLTEEASGDSDDYFQKLRDAEMMLQRMQERDFVPMKSAADTELDLANDLLDRVNANFTVPAANASSAVDTVSEELTTQHNKLRDLRGKLNDATQKANDATTANAVNRKNLTEMTDAINKINSDTTMVNDLLSDADTLLNATVTSVEGPISNGINELDQLHSGLTESIGQLQPFYDQLLTDLENARPVANASIAKANQLADDAAALSAIVQTDSEPHKAANVYQQIYIAMTNAANAAEEALQAATKAEMDVADKNLQAEAEAAEQRSSNLLSETQDLLQNDISNLRNNMDMTNENLTAQEQRVAEFNNRLNALDAAIDGMDRGNMEADIANVVDTAAEAEQAADSAAVQADMLQEQIRNAPDPNTDLPRELAATEQLLSDLEINVPALETSTTNIQNKAERLRGLESSLGLLQKIDDIKRKIALTRHVANGVKSSMQFSSVPEGEPVQYVQLRTPVTVQGLENNLITEFYVNVDAAFGDNSLMYIGDGTRADGDFGAVETVNGKVRYYFKVGGGFRQLESDVAINNGEWHKITIKRIGNFGSLEVEYPSITPGRGDGTPAASFATDYKEGRTDGQEQVANIHRSSMSFYMGGNPMASPPSQIQNTGVGSACIGEVKLNNETIGIWNFKAYNGPKPGQNCQDRPSSDALTNPDNLASGVAGLGSNQVWRFSGFGSYVRIARSDINFLNNNAGSVHFIGFKFETLQDNSLLFLVGQTTEQFMALEVVNGLLVMTWNFGFPGGPVNQTLENVGDVTMQDRQLLVKAGVATVHRVTVVSVDLRLRLRETFDAGVPNVLGDVWIGGMWNSNINPAFRSILTNIDVSFRGCLRELNFNSRSFDIQNAIENIGVTRGCQKEAVADLKLDGGDFVKMPSTLPNIQNIDGSVVMRTGTPSGTILNFRDTEASLDVGIIKPNLKPVDGEDALAGGATAIPAEREMMTTAGGDLGSGGVPVEEDLAAAPAEVNPALDEAGSIGGGGGSNEEEAIDGGANPIDITETELADQPMIDTEEQARYALPPSDDEASDTTAENSGMLPVALIVIGVIVGIVVLAAIVSSVLKSSLVTGPAAPPAPISPEQAPLNDVQAQRTAQMDW